MTPAHPEDDRPDFIVLLDLAPPYSVEDVKQAYLEKAKQAHPDRGGKPEDFIRLQRAYEQATEFAEFKASRMRWLGAQVERYARQEEFIARLKEVGATVDVETVDWLRHSFGDDFAQITEKVTSVAMRGPAFDDASLQALAVAAEDLAGLVSLDLSGSRVTDAGMMRLQVLPNLKRLDLSGTQVTNQGIQALGGLLHLRWLGLKETAANWWGRFRLQRALPNLEIET